MVNQQLTVSYVTVSVQVERLRDFRQDTLAAYADVKKGFDSVHRESLWGSLS